MTSTSSTEDLVDEAHPAEVRVPDETRVVHRPQARQRQELGRGAALPQAPGVSAGLPATDSGSPTSPSTPQERARCTAPWCSTCSADRSLAGRSMRRRRPPWSPTPSGWGSRDATATGPSSTRIRAPSSRPRRSPGARSSRASPRNCALATAALRAAGTGRRPYRRRSGRAGSRRRSEGRRR
jgi:hypothetical protein